MVIEPLVVAILAWVVGKGQDSEHCVSAHSSDSQLSFQSVQLFLTQIVSFSRTFQDVSVAALLSLLVYLILSCTPFLDM